MQINLNIPRDQFYKQYYQILKGILNLSNREIEVLSQFATIRANLSDDISDSTRDKLTFNSINRKIVATELNISLQNLNNYIKLLKKRNVIVLNKDRKMSIHPKLTISLNKPQEIVFKIQSI